MLAVVGFPVWDADPLWIDDFRREHADLRYAPIPPHVTVVFPLEGIDAADLIAHVEQIAAALPPIHMAIRCCIPYHDPLSGQAQLFLVPDEGFSGIVRLHDALYTGRLADHLRLDVPFIPHITVGALDDLSACKRLADAINRQPFLLSAKIGQLSVLSIAGNHIQTTAQVQLHAN